MSSTDVMVGPSMAQMIAAGPPYPPRFQAAGSPATENPDVPVSVIFLVLYALTGAGHMAIFLRNKKQGHKFVLSGAMFAYCVIRTITMCLRIAVCYHSRSIRLGIAAAIFVAVGTVILYVINLFFAQRLMRARHPHIGWHPFFRYALPIAPIALVAIMIIMTIVVVIQSFYTLDPDILQIDRHIQQAALTYFTFIAFLPLIIVFLNLAIPRRSDVDKFGNGRFRTKIFILSASAALLTLGAGYRCGIQFVNPTPQNAPRPWYFSKATFWIFDFVLEFIVVLMYLVVRVDRRFHIPDKAHGAGSYRRGRPLAEKGPLDGDADPEAEVDVRDASTESLRVPPTSHSHVTNGTARVEGKETDTASITSDTYALSIDRRSGKYAMKRVSDSTLGATSAADAYVEPERRKH